MSDPMLVAKSENEVVLLPRMANRHGVITGATGTGKTVTLQTLAQGFSAIGVPVFMADVKGDLSGIAQTGGDNPRAVERGPWGGGCVTRYDPRYEALVHHRRSADFGRCARLRGREHATKCRHDDERRGDHCAGQRCRAKPRSADRSDTHCDTPLSWRST